jgi:hypothetical protein
MRRHDFILLSSIFYPPKAPDKTRKFSGLPLDADDDRSGWPRIEGHFHRVPCQFVRVGPVDEPDLPAVIPGKLLGLPEDVVIEGWSRDVIWG